MIFNLQIIFPDKNFKSNLYFNLLLHSLSFLWFFKLFKNLFMIIIINIIDLFVTVVLFLTVQVPNLKGNLQSILLYSVY